jgi:hypothetical protein
LRDDRKAPAPTGGHFLQPNNRHAVAVRIVLRRNNSKLRQPSTASIAAWKLSPSQSSASIMCACAQRQKTAALSVYCISAPKIFYSCRVIDKGGVARSGYSAERTPSVRGFRMLSALQNANHHEHELARHPSFLRPPWCVARVARIVFRGRWGEHPLAHVPLIGRNQYKNGKLPVFDLVGREISSQRRKLFRVRSQGAGQRFNRDQKRRSGGGIQARVRYAICERRGSTVQQFGSDARY